MGTIQLKDIRLQEYDLDNLQLLRELRKESLAAKPRVCIERARYITEYLKGASDDSREHRMDRRNRMNRMDRMNRWKSGMPGP